MKQFLIIFVFFGLVACGSESEENFEIYGDWVLVDPEESNSEITYVRISRQSVNDKSVLDGADCYHDSFSTSVLGVTDTEITILGLNDLEEEKAIALAYSIVDGRLRFQTKSNDRYYVRSDREFSAIPACPPKPKVEGEIEVSIVFDEPLVVEDPSTLIDRNIELYFDIDGDGAHSGGDIYFKTSEYSFSEYDESSNGVYMGIWLARDDGDGDFYGQGITSDDFDQTRLEISGNTLKFVVKRSLDSKLEAIDSSTPIKLTAEYKLWEECETSECLLSLVYKSIDRLPDENYTADGVDTMDLTDNLDDAILEGSGDYVLDGSEAHLDIQSVKVVVTYQ